MNVISTIDFGSYTGLKKILSSPTFDPKTVTHLDFSRGNHTDTPPVRALKLLPFLKSIDLSHNNINRFNTRNLLEGAPLLEELNFSHNNIKGIEDFVDLGGLKLLKKLTFIETPVVKKLLRIKLIEFLLRPAKYKPYTPIGLLTATYRHVSDEAKVDDAAIEDRKFFFRILERDLDEIDKKEFEGVGTNKYHHKNTPLKLASVECPVPRKTRFPMLTDLNNEKITIQDIRQIFMTEQIQDVINVPNNNARIIKEKRDDIKEQLKGASGKLYRRQLEGCRRQKARRLEEANKPSTIKDPEFFKEDNSDEDEEERKELKHIMQMDKKEEHRLKIEKANYNSALWRHPKDLDVKNAEYNVGIAEHKKMIEDFKARKKTIKESKRLAKREYIRKIREEYRARMKRKAEKAKAKKGSTKTNLDKDEKSVKPRLSKIEELEGDNKEEESWHSFGSDEELKKLFRYQAKKKKKANFEIYNRYNPLDSSESSFTEHESDGEENLDAIQELLRIGTYRDPTDDPTQDEDGEKSKSVLKATKTPIRETKEWKSTMKEFKNKLESIDSGPKIHKTASFDSPLRDVDSSFDFKSSAVLKIHTPHKRALLQKVESIEVVGSPSAGQGRNLPTRFLVAQESAPNLALPGLQSKPKAEIDSIVEVKEESKDESDFTEINTDRKRLSRKSTKEYLAAKEKTDEAKRISMYSPFKKGMKEVEWENVIVQNELANLGQLSAERKKQPMFIYQSHNDLQNESSDEELFNFVTQGKNVEFNKSKRDQEDSNQSLELQHHPSIDYPLSRFARYGSLQVGKSPLNGPVTPLDRSCTPSSFDLEYINALHPQESKIGSRTEKISEMSYKDSRNDLERKNFTPEILSTQPQNSLQGASILKGQENESNGLSFKTNEIVNQSTERTTHFMLSGSKSHSRPSTAPWNIHISSVSSHSNDLAAISEKARKNAQLELNKSTGVEHQVSTPNSSVLGQRVQKSGNKNNSHRKIGQIKLSGSMNFQNVLELAMDLEKSKKFTPKSSPKNQSEQKKPSKDFKIARKRSSIISQQLKIGPIKVETHQNSTPKALMTPTSDAPSDVKKVPKKSLQLLDPNLSLTKALPMNRQSKSLRTTKLVISPPSRNSFVSNLDIGQAGSTRTQPSLYTIGETDSKREIDTRGLLISSRINKLSASPPKIVVRDSEQGPSFGSNSSSVLPRDKLCVEDLLPSEKDGISEEMRLKILNGRVPGMYKRVLDTVERLNAFTKLIKEAEELPVKLNLIPKKDELELPKKEINFEQLAELLRQELKVDKLEFKDYNDLRKLIYLVNDHSHEGELKLGRIEVEEKLRELKLKTLKAEGKELEWLLSEIEELQRYWEILENLHLAKDSHNDPRNIEKLEERELKQAEDKAILTAHGLKLKKYYGEAYVNKHMGGGIKKAHSIDAKDQNKYGQKDLDRTAQAKKHQLSQVLVNEEKLIPSLKNIPAKKSLADEIREIEDKKRNALFADSKAGSWNLQGGTEPLWPGGVERYVPEQIVRIEEHMENIRIKKIGAFYREGSKPLTAEEKLLRKVKNFSQEKIKKKELKVRVEKYVKEAGKTVDEFLANEYDENDKRHDQKHNFQELMKAYYPIKKNTSQWEAFGER